MPWNYAYWQGWYGLGDILVLIVGFVALALLFIICFWIVLRSVQDIKLKINFLEERIDRVEKSVDEILEQLREI